MFTLFITIAVFAVVILSAILGGFSDSSDGGFGTIVIAPLILLLLATIIPSIAVTVRRFHDQDKSGWFYLLGFIPYVGGIVAFIFMCIDGTPGPNQYGPDPKGGHRDIFG